MTFALGGDGTRDLLEARGSKFLDAVESASEGVGHYIFSGTSNAEMESGHSETCRNCSQTNSRDQIDGTIIVDPAVAI